MAGDWIKMRKEIDTDPRVVGISERLRVHVDRVVGAFRRVWSVADSNSTDGRLAGYTARTIDRIADLRGFADTAVVVGTPDHPPWLVIDAAGVTIPDFHKHMGDSWKRRERERIKKEGQRAGQKRGQIGGQTGDKNGTNVVPEAEAEQEKDRSLLRAAAGGPESSASRFCLPACPDGDDPAALLAALRVGEPAASVLVAGGVSAEDIRAEWEGIRVNARVRKPLACLVTALEKRRGIKIPKRGMASAGDTLAAEKARLHKLRELAAGGSAT